MAETSIFVDASPADLHSRDGIHESTISLRFLRITLIFLRLEIFLRSFLSFYKMLFSNKLEFSSLIDRFVLISETIGVVWFSVRISSFLYNSHYCFYGKKCIYI